MWAVSEETGCELKSDVPTGQILLSYMIRLSYSDSNGGSALAGSVTQQQRCRLAANLSLDCLGDDMARCWIAIVVVERRCDVVTRGKNRFRCLWLASAEGR